MDRVIIHVDMDAFYAAVEQRDNAAYRGRAVVVGSDPKQGRGRGVVATCSYEARRFGIHSAQPISQAYRLCPQAVFVRPDFPKYRDVSRQIRTIFASFTPLVEPLSIDEAFLDVSHIASDDRQALEVARAVKHRIFREQQLTASVGVAPNKFVAKIASDLHKPNGLLLVHREEVEQFLSPLPVSRIWGVGPKTEEKLNRLGIQSISQLRKRDESDLSRHFGKLGGHLWRLARGIDDRPVVVQRETKSVSNEHTFGEDVSDLETLQERLGLLSQKVAQRLQRADLRGRTIVLKLRYGDFTTLTRQESFPVWKNDGGEILESALRLFRQNYEEGRALRLIGVGVCNFERPEEQGPQLSLF